MRATCPIRLILPDFITLIIFGKVSSYEVHNYVTFSIFLLFLVVFSLNILFS